MFRIQLESGGQRWSYHNKMPKADDETENLRKELQGLADKCREEQKNVCDSSDMGSGSALPKGKIVTRRQLRGHINKVTCCHFSGDSRHAVTGSLDGKLIVWDCWTGNKVQVCQVHLPNELMSLLLSHGIFYRSSH